MKQSKKNPLSKAQKRLLRESLRALLGPGLIQYEESSEEKAAKALMLKAALGDLILK